MLQKRLNLKNNPIINNDESISCLGPLFERGVEWFKSLGRENNHGPKLWCVSGHVKRPGVYETALGIPLDELLEEHCGGVRDGHRWKAAVPGGSSAYNNFHGHVQHLLYHAAQMSLLRKAGAVLSPRYAGAFDRVVFAIPASGGRGKKNFAAFRETLVARE